MPDVTVVIPVSPYHIDLLPAALASVRAQTIPCETVVFYDEDKRGAGHARNEALQQVKTDLVVFLDADDLLKPTFAERTLDLYQQTGRYIYTDWEDETGRRYSAPDCAWVNLSYHLITTLLPTDWVCTIGGFDESLPAGEDSDFYTHLVTVGYCGMHLAETLVTYTHGGRRSAGLLKSTVEQIRARYRGKTMGCCDDAPLSPPAPMGERVLVMPTWGLGTRTVIGQATGTHYGRLDASTEPVLMDRRDIAMRPDLYRVIEQPEPVAASSNGGGFKALVHQLVGKWETPAMLPAPVPYVPTPAAVVPSAPDVARVLRLTGHIPKKTADPVFVFPDKDYPSYTDVRRLVELSGFTVVKQSDPAGFIDGQPIIYLSPEQPPKELFTPYKSTIWWSLEYGGEYEPDLSDWKGEVWASDPTWAAAHDAKFVVMGSHPDLKTPDIPGGYPNDYDVTMLAYMTPRRQTLKDKLSDLRWPGEIYPGHFTYQRHAQLRSAALMLHAHQREDTSAIAPQRFALCAAYHLPLIHEAVSDEGAYVGAARFEPYENLAAATREELADPSNDRGEALYNWLCEELTFRKSVEGALK